MKKFFLLLTLIAATFSAWGASTYSNLYVAGAGTRKEGWTGDKITMTKNGNIFTYTGYFYVAGSSDGFKIATNSTDFTDAFHPAGGSHVVITSGTTYNLTKTASPDSKFRVPSEGWYTITIDQSKTPETLKMESRQSPLELYPSGSGTSIGWKTTTVMKETSNGSGIYAGEITFNPASSNSEFKFFTNTNTSLNFHYGPADPSNKSLPSVGTYNIKYYSGSKDGDIKFQVNNNALSGKFYVKVNVKEGKMYVKPISTISFTSNPTSKAYTDAAFNVAVTAQSKGAVTYSSSDPNVASIDATTGRVTPHVPGTTTITAKVAEDDTYGPNTVNYTLTVTGTVPTYIKKESSTITALKTKLNWPTPPSNGKEYSNFAINDVLTFSYGKHLYENISGIGTTDMLRYYYQTSQYASGSLTIRAKAGVIIQSVTLTYSAGSNSVFSDEYCYGESAAEGHKVESGVPFKVDANSVTFYNSLKDKTKSGGGINVIGYEITYFDPSEGVAVTKTLFDLEKNQGLKDNTCYQNIALNEAINIYADNTGTMRYSNSGFIACYRWTGSIDINARKGATIHYVKVTYVQIPNFTGVLSTKSTTGSAVPEADRIASDSIIFVNSNSLKLYVGNTNGSDGRIGITKIYVNYTDGSEVVVDNFNNCDTIGSTEPVSVVGVNNKINWSIEKFTRDNTNRMYYDQSIKLNKGGKIFTPIVGALDEVAFDWHPTEANKNIKFYVKAGGTTYTVDSAAAKMDKAYTINFKKTNIQNNDTLAIMVDANSGTALEIGHVSIKPVLTYSANAVSINAEAYQSQNWKYTNNTLINNTGATASYSITESPDVAVIDAETGEVTIKGAGTVTVTAEAGGKSASYNLTINLLDAGVAFAKKDTSVYLSEGSYTPVVSKSTTAKLFYEFIGDHEGATIDGETGKVEFTAAGTYKVKASAPLTLPYKAGVDSFTLTVNDKPLPQPYFKQTSLVKDINDEAFIDTLLFLQDVGTGEGLGDTTYVRSNDTVAIVGENGEVTIIGAGTVKIKAILTEGTSFAADSAEYTLTVLPLPEMSFEKNSKFVYLNAGTVTNALTISQGAGAVSYESSDDEIATVDATSGLVTIVKDGTVTITAKSEMSGAYSAGSLGYQLEVSPLKLPTASFTEGTVNKVQGFEAFTNTSLTTTSDGVKTYESSDTRVATVNAETGEVTKGEKPGQTIIKVKIAASDTWEKIEASYTLNVSSAPIADMHPVSKTVADIKQSNWENGKEYSNVPIDDKLTLSKCKYYTGQGGESRYYYNANPQYVSSTTFTIQAKAGVIIKSVKFTYNQGNANMILADGNYGDNVVAEAHRIISGETYKVDANAVTYYVGRIGATSTDNHINISKFEITYFDPSEGVAVTKSASDIAKDMGIGNEGCADELVINQAASIHIADPTYSGKTLRYYTSGPQFNMYVHTGGIDIKARKGAKIRYLKITYSRNYNAVLTKYFGTNGYNIPDVDCIASDSIIYVNADSIRLYAGTTNQAPVAQQYPSVAIKKIYVNYTDNSEVTVDNFNNCTQTSGDSVAVAGVDGKFNWTFKNFSRKDTITNRMYYDQSVLINKGGKIYTPISGALKEVAFDWHPTEANKEVKFYVKAGGETITVDSTMANTYTINFKKANIQNYDTFAIEVDANSATTLEIGHVSLTPYMIYTNKEVTIDAKDYKDAGYKYTNSSLINYTGKTVEYSTSDASIASIDATTGEVTIQTGGTVTISATADGATTSYSLTINLESTSAEFNDHAPERLVTAGSYKQKLHITTEATEGNQVNYTFVGEHDGATLSDSTVTFTKEGVFTIKGRLEQNLPYAAAEDEYVLTVTGKDIPHIEYAKTDTTREITDGKFTNPLWTPGEGVGDTTYVSTDPTVAIVDEFGEVTPLKVGETTIKAYVAEGTSYAADSAKYTLHVYALPKPVMHFAKDTIKAYRNTDDFINELTIEYGDGKITYASSDIDVATIQVMETGTVKITGPGTATIFAYSKRTDNYQADTISYTVSVENKHLVTATFGESSVTKYLSEKTYTNTVTLNPDSYDGTISYSSDNIAVATVENDGTVTFKKNGSAKIKVQLAGTAKYKETSASYTLTVLADPIEDIGTIKGNVPHYADSLHWVSGDTAANCYKYFKLDENIAICSENGNAMYKKDGDKKYLRYYQGTNKGQFTIRAKAGVIIQEVKFNYTNDKNGVLTTNYGTDGTSISSNKIESGKTYKVDGNRVSFYTGSTSTNKDGEVRIVDYVVKYFDPSEGVSVTKTGTGLGKELSLTPDQCYQNIAINNVITMHADDASTMRFKNNGFDCYRHKGAIDIKARVGTTIHYVKITYASATNVDNFILTKYWVNKGFKVPAVDQIASDSILYVNANSLKLYIGTGQDTVSTWSGVKISKIYVNYSDETAIVDNFDNCTALYGDATPTSVEGVDGTYNWNLTQFNRDSVRRIGYDQSIMLRNGAQKGKIETVGDEGGVKEVSFDYCASNNNQGVKFYVKVGEESETVSYPEISRLLKRSIYESIQQKQIQLSRANQDRTRVRNK